jgi:hypothetical protein
VTLDETTHVHLMWVLLHRIDANEIANQCARMGCEHKIQIDMCHLGRILQENHPVFDEQKT